MTANVTFMCDICGDKDNKPLGALSGRIRKTTITVHRSLIDSTPADGPPTPIIYDMCMKCYNTLFGKLTNADTLRLFIQNQGP